MRAEINDTETKKEKKKQNRTMKLGAGSLKELIRLINTWPHLSKRKEKGSK